MLLPRQFHVMVVENCSERHISTAMWMFPLYLFLINLFVLPIAVGGLVLFGDTQNADTFVLLEPLRHSQPALALVAFLGGLSAAAGMVIVSSVALSIMLLNNLLLPLLVRYRWREDLSGVLIHLKRGGIIAILLVGYLYSEAIGPSLSLVNMGLLSFAAAAQLTPAVFGGLLWRRATAKGAAAGLVMGLLTWIYLFLTPALAWSGILPAEWLTSGPFGITLLRPNAFLGLTGLDIWSHGLVWSALLNCGTFIVVSLMTEPSRAEIEQVARMVHAERGVPAEPREYRLARAPTVAEFEGLLAKFVGPKKARQRIRAFFAGTRVDRDETLPDRTVVRLRQYVESQLGGVLGATAANEVVERYLAVKGTRMEEVFDVFGEVSLSLEESRTEVERRVRELSVLYEASKRIAETLDEKEAVGAVLDLLESDFGLRCQGVLFYDGEQLTMGPTRGEGRRLAQAAEGGPPQSAGVIGRAILAERTVMATLEESGWFFGGSSGQRSLLATPIRKENRTLGVLFAASSTASGYFSETFIETFEALASELALAVSNARLFTEVRDLNRTLEEKVRDRTAELQAAYTHLQEMDRVKSQFLANMSHELRTPMNAILGFTQLVLDGVDGPLTDEQTASLQRVEKNAGHLLALINDLLDLSRIESGKMALDLHPINVGVLAQDVAADLCATAEAKGLYCVCETPGEPVQVRADPMRLRQVLNNLVNNAIKFTERGGVTTRVAPRSDGIEGVSIEVSDTGIGIPSEKHEVIFDAFRQLDGSNTRAHGGAGLGLSITKRIVELHGGTIRVASRPGEGSTFTVLLPSEPPANAERDSDGFAHPGG
jgi:signal transduction histidine kinase